MSSVNLNTVLEALNNKMDLDATNANPQLMTNYIAKWPQDIKVELNDGVLTLKKDSKVYYPDGFESDGVTRKFSYYLVPRDVDLHYPSSEVSASRCMVVGIFDTTPDVSQAGVYWVGLEALYSGDTAPSDVSWINTTWYDTSENRIKIYYNNTWNIGANGYNFVFPICLFDVLSTKKVSGLQHIFNGIGFIGTCLYALPGITYLLPDGVDQNGNYKNLTITTEKVTIQNFTTITNRYMYINLNKNGGIDYHGYGSNNFSVNWYANRAHYLVYDAFKNKYYQSDANNNYHEANDMIVGVVYFNDKHINQIRINSSNEPVVTYYKTEHVVSSFVESVNGNNYTWYRTYRDGWVEQGGTSTSGTNAATMNLPIAMANDKYVLLGHMVKAGTSMEDSNDIVPRFWNRTATSFNYRLMSVNGSGGYERDWCWQVSGMMKQ